MVEEGMLDKAIDSLIEYSIKSIENRFVSLKGRYSLLQRDKDNALTKEEARIEWGQIANATLELCDQFQELITQSSRKSGRKHGSSAPARHIIYCNREGQNTLEGWHIIA